MSVYALKPAFQRLLRPLVETLAHAGATANQVTIAATLGSLTVGAFVAQMAPVRWPFLLVPIWLFARMALNAIDGMLAREHSQKSRLGAYLNELGDVVSDAALYAPFALLPAFGAFWIGLVIVLAVISELAGVLGVTVGASRRYDGPMGKSDRALIFGALGLWIGLGGAVPAWTQWILIALAVLLIFTIDNRMRAGLREIGSNP